MTKKEIIEILTDKYGVEDKGLMKKTVKELEEMLKDEERKVKEGKASKSEVSDIGFESSTEEVAEKSGEVSEETSDDKKKGVVSEVQLNIYETIIRRFEPPKDLRIENLGVGDVFVGETKENLIQEQNKIIPGQSVEIPNASVLYITSASRPIIRITY